MAKKKVFFPPETIDGSQLMDEWDCDAAKIIELVNKRELEAFDSWFGETVNLDYPPDWTPGNKRGHGESQIMLQQYADLHRSGQKKHMKRWRFKKPDVQDSPSKSDIFPCESGTCWEDITITLMADDMVRIQTPTHDERLTYHQLGMSDKRRGDRPKEVWATLKLFCENDGIIIRENIKYDRLLRDKTYQLNKQLKQLFGISESIYQGHYKAMKGYITRIHFKDQTFS